MKNKLIIPVIIMAAAIIFTMVFNAVKSDDYKDWLPADGIVTRLEQGRKFRIQVYFTYQADGEQYSSYVSLHSRWDEIPSTDDEITVWYDSKDHSRAEIHKPELSLLDTIAPMFIAIPLAVGVMLVNAGKRYNTNI